MKIKGILFAAALLASFSCDNMLDTGILSNEGQACDNLSISVLTTPPTKDLITTAYFPTESQIGVFVTNSTGGDYDGHSYNNILYTADGSDANQTWNGSTIELSMNEGKCYAYYPYSSSVTDMTNIPVSTTGQVDYMYAAPVTVNASNKNAALTMNHALSAVRFMIKKGTYAGAGQVTAVSVKSSALGTSGSLNAKTGEVTGVSGKGSTISVSKSLKLSASTQNVDVIVVPTGSAADITLSVTLDGKTYSTVVSGAAVTKANCNKYTLTVNVGELALSGIEIGDWGYNVSGAPTITAGSYKVTFAGDYKDIAFENSVSGSNVTIKALNLEGYPVNAVTKTGTATLSQTVTGMVRTITLAGIGSNVTVNFKGHAGPPAALADNWSGLSDGVYAIRPDGKPADAKLANESCSVGLVYSGKAIEVAKVDAGSSKWAASYPLTNEEAAHFSANWLISSETADMDGKGNTQRILDAGVKIATVINNFNTSNGTTEWYLPSLGQLSKIQSNMSKINTLLGKVSGTELPKYGYYWSSSIYSERLVWMMPLNNGWVRNVELTNDYDVRLVRDL